MIRYRKGQGDRLLLRHVVLQHLAVEGLLQAVRCDEAEAFRFASAGELSGLVPPEHHEVRTVGYVLVCTAQCFGIAIAQGFAHA